MEKVYARPKVIMENASIGFCPGCIHATTHKLLYEVLEELDVIEKTMMVWGIGCCGLGSSYAKVDGFHAPHGRALACASAYKRTNPDELVITYQGDGDLASIGIAETVHAANRGENLTTVFVNNATYGMTGGQMAPTTLLGQKATTAPFGRTAEQHGYPVHICEMLNTLKAPVYLTRVTCLSVPEVIKTKAAIKKAIQNQIDGKGYSMVEVVSNCPTNWGMTPLETLEFMKENTLKEYPLGVFRDN